MSQIEVSQVTEIDIPELREIATRVVKIMQLAAEKATVHQAEPATYPIAPDPNSFEQLFLSRFQQLRPEQQQVGISKVMAAIKAPEAERVRIYGDLAKVDLHSATAVEVQTQNLPLPNSLNKLQNEEINLLQLQSQNLSGAESRFTPQYLSGKLDLRIHKVKCIDETNELGDDLISLGGNTIDESGDTEKIPPFEVKHFESGEEFNYSPPKIFASFDLLENPTVQWPRSYFVTLVLAEIDWGGFPDFVNKLLEKVKQEVIIALTTALGSAIGTVIGSGVPILGTTIGAVIGAAVGWVVGKAFEYFKSVWDDEIFPPATLRVNIPSLDARWDGKTESPQSEIWWKGYGGEYHLWYDWHIESEALHPLPEPTGLAEFRYNAVWDKTPGAQTTSDWIAGWLLEHFQSKNAELTSQGFYLTDLQVYDIGGSQWRYNAVWNKTPGAQTTSDWIAGWLLEHFQSKNAELTSQGFYLTDLQVYDIGGSQWRYNAVWNKTPGAQTTSDWIAGWLLEHFQSKNAELTSQGFYLTDLQVYDIGGSQWRYNAVWNKTPGAQTTSDWIAGWLLEHFQSKNAELTSQGFYLTDLQVYDIGGSQWRYNAVWNKTPGAQTTSDWIAGWLLEHFQSKNAELTSQGFYLTDLQVYEL